MTRVYALIRAGHTLRAALALTGQGPADYDRAKTADPSVAAHVAAARRVAAALRDVGSAATAAVFGDKAAAERADTARADDHGIDVAVEKPTAIDTISADPTLLLQMPASVRASFEAAKDAYVLAEEAAAEWLNQRGGPDNADL